MAFISVVSRMRGSGNLRLPDSTNEDSHVHVVLRVAKRCAKRHHPGELTLPRATFVAGLFSKAVVLIISLLPGERACLYNASGAK